MGNSDNDIFFPDKILDADLVVQVGDLRLAFVTKLVFYFLKLLTDDPKTKAFIGKQLFQVGDELHQLVILCTDLIPFHSRKTLQTQLEDRACLDLVESPAGVDKTFPGNLGCGRSPDKGDDLVKMVQGDQIAL